MASLNVDSISIVEWFEDVEKHRCGYCNGKNCSASNGMWAETLTVEDYQNLIDRGWRRSGKYCYKPIMDETCCPQYAIRCDVTAFAVSKSQKKVIKRFNKFLADGLLTKKEPENAEQRTEAGFCFETRTRENPHFDINALKGACIEQMVNDYQIPSSSSQNDASADALNIAETTALPAQVEPQWPNTAQSSSSFRKGVGADALKPPCKKAKLLRLERKQQKMLQRGMSLEKLHNAVESTAKSLQQFLEEIPNNAKHRLTIRMVAMSEPGDDWEALKTVEFELYRKYQMKVHNDPPDKCTMHGFTRFLVTSPLKFVHFENGVEGPGYGSFHQQYWLDDKLVAVGVLDILPRCISSVYFFYDPDYRSLTLGTYGSMRELQLVRSLGEKIPAIRYYYMGFYIHSCPKMRYKGKLSASSLLCPETYEWIPIEKCIPRLEVSKYARLNENIDALDVNSCEPCDIDSIKVLIGYRYNFFAHYKYKNRDRELFYKIGSLVGKRCTNSLLFVR